MAIENIGKVTVDAALLCLRVRARGVESVSNQQIGVHWQLPAWWWSTCEVGKGRLVGCLAVHGTVQ